jgi:hypothetical protein
MQLVGAAFVYLITFVTHGLMTGAIVSSTRHVHTATSESAMLVRLSALLTVTMFALLAAHLAEIAMWTVYYTAIDLEVRNASLFEFAFENYTALGYGDAVAGEGYRLIGPVTSLNGLLLIGWSVAIIFEVLRMAELQIKVPPKRARRRARR